MDRITKWTLYGLSILLSGCTSYSTINLDVMEPAKVKFPVDIASVVIVDNALPYRDTALHVVKSGSRRFLLDTLQIDDFGSRLAESLASTLKSQQFFDSVYVAENHFKPDSSEGFQPTLSFFQIDSLRRRYHAQAVISLDRYEYNTITNVVDVSDFYYLTLDAHCRAYWKIFNALDGTLMDVHLQEDTIFWAGEDYGLTQAFKSLPGLKEAVEDVADYSGGRYAAYVAPSWSSESRIYFTQGHPLFYEATRYLLGGQWEKTLPIWYRVYEEGKEKQKARSAYNLALGQEVLGNNQEALAWAYRAVKHYEGLGGMAVSEWEKKLASLYYIQLSERFQKKKKLDDQFGFDE